MFDRRSEHVPLLRMRDQRAVNRRIVAFGAATGENDLARIGVDQRRHFFPRRFDVFGDALSKRVNAGRISPKIAQKRNHRVHDFRRDPGRGVVVEIINRLCDSCLQLAATRLIQKTNGRLRLELLAAILLGKKHRVFKPKTL